MLQNRVDPFGNIVRTSARGLWMGNRGLLHDDQQNLVRPFRLKAWLICVLEFKGRQRKVMSPRLYTELFFMDEATAFAAGHRPCSECRRADFNKFKSLWLKSNPEYGFAERVHIAEIDNILHSERMDEKGAKVTYTEAIENIPDGTFIAFNAKPFMIANGLMFAWTPYGYEQGMALPETESVTVLTPRSVVNTFRAGYLPQMAISTID